MSLQHLKLLPKKYVLGNQELSRACQISDEAKDRHSWPEDFAQNRPAVVECTPDGTSQSMSQPLQHALGNALGSESQGGSADEVWPCYTGAGRSGLRAPSQVLTTNPKASEKGYDHEPPAFRNPASSSFALVRRVCVERQLRFGASNGFRSQHRRRNLERRCSGCRGGLEQCEWRNRGRRLGGIIRPRR